MREQLYDRIDDIHARVGIEKKLLLVGHSLGALLANLVALDKPEKVAGVVALTGVHDGIKKETPASLALRYALGNPPHGKVLKHDSEFMEELRERRTNEWPAGVPLDVISTALDYLIVPPQGYGIQLPNGERSNDKLIVPRGLGLEAAVRLSLGIKKEVQVVRSGYFEPVEHVNAPRNRLVINSIKERWLSLGGAAPDVSVESAKKVVLRSQPQAAVA
jgi:pimeloyl-ACP methyl ester carboxylesterase